MKALREGKPIYGLGRLPRYCFIPGMFVRLAETYRKPKPATIIKQVNLQHT